MSLKTEKNCHEEADSGMCLGYFPMWYFDYDSETCKEFIYGGCQGNGNRYATKEECLRTCASSRCRCPENQIYTTLCSCEDNCFNPPEVCAAVCLKGCFCRPGYIRLYDSEGPCIPESYCPFL
ncbi:papilin [Trichonephila clavata]|uniref:Papilin n=1 Tax=Trichonephila clavata TaxID=2740835 RepID=A0A8X6LYU2_TRICU|nr:papilin [Trichonephila clavata]